MNNLNTSNEVKPSSKLKTYAKRVGLGIAALFAIIVLAAIVDSSNDPVTQTPAEQNAKVLESAPVEDKEGTATESFNIAVTSQIIKKVDGKYRYFFDIRNNDTKDFNGSVTIQLVTAEGRKISKETFNTNKAISPGLGTSQYIDANTGPVSTHGESGYAKFTYEVKVGSDVVKTGEGALSNQYEDLSN